MAYGHAMGYLPFREAIAECLGTVRAVRCDASQILVTTGSQLGLAAFRAGVCSTPTIRCGSEEPAYRCAPRVDDRPGAQVNSRCRWIKKA